MLILSLPHPHDHQYDGSGKGLKRGKFRAVPDVPKIAVFLFHRKKKNALKERLPYLTSN
jgi:hypothetical protein